MLLLSHLDFQSQIVVIFGLDALTQLHTGNVKLPQKVPQSVRDENSHRLKMETFSSKHMAMKAQKKILSHMANKSVMQMFIDDTSSEILDELYRVSKEHTGNRNEAQKVVKNMIKVAVKVGVLFRHERFSADELSLAHEFKKKFHHGAMTAISFQEVEFTFDKSIMIDNLVICRDILLQLVEKHLTPKSLDRIRHVFNHYADPDLLTNLYDHEGSLWPHLTKICGGLNKLIEEGKL
ncbi:tumor necrosis factor, alpha-induced protein 8-like protein 2 A isoform X2 [Alosa sapidissima]|uniref:tumor necrosis factor, alpha-induced protein 8-like protein 2 A isoform X2 n=1 Tax=Alosa sapidissima TaxID=34773 RepID=UPI001C096085|nr:tumor necrosis factor, alpha-induced protein 8-like protein 2 A isoform X2 [Alosa sapidissima]